LPAEAGPDCGRRRTARTGRLPCVRAGAAVREDGVHFNGVVQHVASRRCAWRNVGHARAPQLVNDGPQLGADSRLYGRPAGGGGQTRVGRARGPDLVHDGGGTGCGGPSIPPRSAAAISSRVPGPGTRRRPPGGWAAAGARRTRRAPSYWPDSCQQGSAGGLQARDRVPGPWQAERQGRHGSPARRAAKIGNDYEVCSQVGQGAGDHQRTPRRWVAGRAGGQGGGSALRDEQWEP